MISCPRAQELLSLLDEQLDRAGETRLVAHVETCASCQAYLDELVRSRLPNAPWIRPPAACPRADDPAALWASRFNHELGVPGPAPGAPATPGNLTVDCARSTPFPTTGDPTATDSDHVGVCLAPTDFDLLEPALRGAAIFSPNQLIADFRVTTDDTPAVPGGPIRGRSIGVDTVEMTALGPPKNGDGTAIESDPAALSPRLTPDRSGTGRPLIPGYEILEKLGEGGMGVVYKARHQGLNRLVALKMMIGGNQGRADLLPRFRIEAEALARLRHPNILQIYDIGEVDGLPFVSLELLEGGSLDDRLAGTPQAGRSGADLVATLARAVHAAHQAGIVHRDLKPANVLFNADGVPKITDFGLAKRLESDSRQTATGQIMGSPSYMAPEQARGQAREVGPAADVYALGAILYEALTGRPPFKGETPIDTVRQVIDNDPVLPSRLVPRVPRDLETICLKCIHKEPQKRYDSAQELADDLDRFRDGNTIRARRTSVCERGLKWSRRRPVAALVAALFLLAAVVSSLGGVAYVRHERLQNDRRNNLVLNQQNRGLELLHNADEAASPEQLQKAQVALSEFLRDIKDERRLAKTYLGIAEKSRWVADKLRILAARDQAQTAAREARIRFQRFLDLRQEAHLYGAGFAVLGPTDRLEKLRDTALAALTLYSANSQAPGGAWTLIDPLPAALTEAQKTRVRDGCYDLLLILPQALDPAQGLRILDQAVRLRRETTAAYHLRRADCLDRAGDLAGRDREARVAREKKPATALDYFLIGRELTFRRQFADAIRALNTALRHDPDQTSAHLLLAVAHFNLRPKGLSEARTSLSACIRRNPDLVGLYLMRASVDGEEGSLVLGKTASEQAALPQAPRLPQEAAEAFEAAEDDYRRALELNPSDDLRYALLANRGLLRLRSGRLDQALADLDSAIRLKPDQYQAHSTLAQVLERKGRLDAAGAALTRAIACRPEPIVLAGLFRTRALLHAPRKDLTADQQGAALRDLGEAIRHEPDAVMKAGDHVWRARLYFGRNQSLEALAACDAALMLAPDSAEAHKVRISALMELKRYDEVLGSSDAYLARGNPSAEIFEIRGLARVARREYPAAIADFHRALELKPEREPVERSRLLNLRGWAYHFTDAPRLALADFEESLRLDPSQSDAYASRGLARIRLGQWRDAVADADVAIDRARAASAGSTDAEGRAAKVQALFNAARIYAMAADFAARDVSRRGERAVTLYRGYRNRALNLIDEALKMVPDRQRRQEILADPSLRPLRLRPLRGSESSALSSGPPIDLPRGQSLNRARSDLVPTQPRSDVTSISR